MSGASKVSRLLEILKRQERGVFDGPAGAASPPATRLVRGASEPMLDQATLRSQLGSVPEKQPPVHSATERAFPQAAEAKAAPQPQSPPQPRPDPAPVSVVSPRKAAEDKPKAAPSQPAQSPAQAASPASHPAAARAKSSPPLSEAQLMALEQDLLAQLIEMGYPADYATRALKHVNVGSAVALQRVLNWMEEHPPQEGHFTDANIVQMISTLEAMGFAKTSSARALQNAGNDIQKAIVMLLSEQKHQLAKSLLKEKQAVQNTLKKKAAIQAAQQLNADAAANQPTPAANEPAQPSVSIQPANQAPPAAAAPDSNASPYDKLFRAEQPHADLHVDAAGEEAALDEVLAELKVAGHDVPHEEEAPVPAAAAAPVHIGEEDVAPGEQAPSPSASASAPAAAAAVEDNAAPGAPEPPAAPAAAAPAEPAHPEYNDQSMSFEEITARLAQLKAQREEKKQAAPAPDHSASMPAELAVKEVPDTRHDRSQSVAVESNPQDKKLTSKIVELQDMVLEYQNKYISLRRKHQRLLSTPQVRKVLDEQMFDDGQ